MSFQFYIKRGYSLENFVQRYLEYEVSEKGDLFCGCKLGETITPNESTEHARSQTLKSEFYSNSHKTNTLLSGILSCDEYVLFNLTCDFSGNSKIVKKINANTTFKIGDMKIVGVREFNNYLKHKSVIGDFRSDVYIKSKKKSDFIKVGTIVLGDTKFQKKEPKKIPKKYRFVDRYCMFLYGAWLNRAPD